MKRMNIRRILPVIAATMILFSGCNKWLDVKPSDQITDKTLFQDGSGFRNALNGIYQQVSAPELYGRELSWGLNSIIAQDYNPVTAALTTTHLRIAEYKFTESVVTPVVSSIWAKSFTAIANCNKLLSEISAADPGVFAQGEMEKNLIMGEAMAMRAMLHFDLLRLFAPSPLANRTGNFLPYQTNYPSRYVAPLSTDAVLKNIVADLESAQRLVAQNDTLTNVAAFSEGLNLRLSGSQTSAIPIVGGVFFNFRLNRVNFVAIHGLLARIYLYGGDRVNAKKEAEYVYKKYGPAGKSIFTFTSASNATGAGKFPKLADDLLLAFYDPDLPNKINTYKTTQAKTYALNPAFSTWFPSSERDYRRNYINATNGSDKWVSSTSSAQYVQAQNLIIPILRLSEVYYIYSECLFEEGNTTAALRVLNEVRFARDKTNTFSGTSSDAYYQELLNEYRREFLTEGQTVFAHKRLVRPIVIGTRRIEMDSKFTLPLPDGELIF